MNGMNGMNGMNKPANGTMVAGRRRNRKNRRASCGGKRNRRTALGGKRNRRNNGTAGGKRRRTKKHQRK